MNTDIQTELKSEGWKDEPNLLGTAAPIRLFVMGENLWRDEAEFPLARTQYTEYFLHSQKAPNSAAGDGALSIEKPRKEPRAFFLRKKRSCLKCRGCCGSGVKKSSTGVHGASMRAGMRKGRANRTT